MKGHSNKRSALRQPFEQTVTFERSSAASGAREWVLGNAHGVDLTSSGFGFTTDRELTAGEVLRLYLPVGSTDITVPVYSEIVWTDSSGSNCRAGLRFLA